jgi:hypothetical protein
MEQTGIGKGASEPEDLESWCYRNLIIGGALLAIGLVFTLTAVLAWWGIPLLIVGGLIVAYDIIQAMRWLRTRGIDVTCPYCHKQYRIMPNRGHLLCDDCQKEIPVPRAA